MFITVALVVWLILTPVVAWLDWRDSKGHVHFPPHSVGLSLLMGALWPVQVLAIAAVWALVKLEERANN